MAKKVRLRPSNRYSPLTCSRQPISIGRPTNNTPRWRLGYIRKFSQNSMIGLDIGFGNRATSLIRTGEDYSLWEIRPEYYRTFRAKNGKTIKYFSVETFYIHQREIFTFQSFFTEQNQYLTFERARYRRLKMGIVPKLGMFIKISGRLGLNLYSGFGLNLRLNRYDNFSGLVPRDFDEESYPPYYRNEGNRIGVEFSLGAKLYVRTNDCYTIDYSVSVYLTYDSFIQKLVNPLLVFFKVNTYWKYKYP